MAGPRGYKRDLGSPELIITDRSSPQSRAESLCEAGTFLLACCVQVEAKWEPKI